MPAMPWQAAHERNSFLPLRMNEGPSIFRSFTPNLAPRVSMGVASAWSPGVAAGSRESVALKSAGESGLHILSLSSGMVAVADSRPVVASAVQRFA